MTFIETLPPDVLQIVIEQLAPGYWLPTACACTATNAAVKIAVVVPHPKSLTWTSTCTEAAKNGHLAVLQWARAQGCP